jgi:hypothetical protein
MRRAGGIAARCALIRARQSCPIPSCSHMAVPGGYSVTSYSSEAVEEAVSKMTPAAASSFPHPPKFRLTVDLSRGYNVREVQCQCVFLGDTWGMVHWQWAWPD